MQAGPAHMRVSRRRRPGRIISRHKRAKSMGCSALPAIWRASCDPARCSSKATDNLGSFRGTLGGTRRAQTPMFKIGLSRAGFPSLLFFLPLLGTRPRESRPA